MEVDTHDEDGVPATATAAAAPAAAAAPPADAYHADGGGPVPLDALADGARYSRSRRVPHRPHATRTDVYVTRAHGDLDCPGGGRGGGRRRRGRGRGGGGDGGGSGGGGNGRPFTARLERLLVDRSVRSVAIHALGAATPLGVDVALRVVARFGGPAFLATAVVPGTVLVYDDFLPLVPVRGTRAGVFKGGGVGTGPPVGWQRADGSARRRRCTGSAAERRADRAPWTVGRDGWGGKPSTLTAPAPPDRP